MKKTLIISLALTLLVIGLVQATTLSITDSKFNQFDQNFLAPSWSVITRGDNSADYIALAPATSIKGTDSAGTPVQAVDGFSLQSQIISETCNYPFVADPTLKQLFQYKEEVTRKSFWWEGKTEMDNCKKKPGYFTGYTKYGVGVLLAQVDVYCYTKQPINNVKKVDDSTLNFQAKFTLNKIGGEGPPPVLVKSLAETPADIPGTVEIKDSSGLKALIKWIGGATTGSTCPSQATYVAMENTDNTYSIISKDRYTEYQDNALQIEELAKIINARNNTSPASTQQVLLTQLMTTTADRLTAAKQPVDLVYQTTKAAITGATAVLELPRTHLIYQPDFQILVNADWLKIVYLVGKPKITSAGFISCDETSMTNHAQVTVQNVGATQGRFSVGLSCDQGISISENNKQITLDPQQTGTVDIPFSLALQTDVARSCNIVVADVNTPTIKDTKVITGDCLAQKTCTPEGIITCIGTDEVKCTNGNWVNTLTNKCANNTGCNLNNKCEAGESFEKCGGKASSSNDCATCKVDGSCDPTETIYSCPSDCGNIPKKDNTWLYIILGGVGAVGLYLVVNPEARKNLFKGRRK